MSDPHDLVALAALSSGTRLEDEYRLVDSALSRTPRKELHFEADKYDPKALAEAQRTWIERTRAEHRSTTVFSELCGQLVEANATTDAKLVMLRMAQDELRHTEICRDVVISLGQTEPILTSVAVLPLARHKGITAEERALRNVIYATCMSEMLAVAMLVDGLEEMSDPYLHEATRQLLADEVLHGQFGFHYLAAQRPFLDAHPEVHRSLERYLVHAFAVLVDTVIPGVPVAKARTEDERALGITDPERVHAVIVGTLEHAVVPGLERLGLAAGDAYQNRRRLD